MGSGFENLILFGLLSLMLLIGTLLRAKVKLFQDYLVPASIIGGLIGFAIALTGSCSTPSTSATFRFC